MAQTKTQRRTTPAKAPARKRPATTKGAPSEVEAATARTAELSDEVLHSIETGQRAAIQAVTKFLDTVDQALPLHGEGASKRQTVIDSAMEMADRLVHVQYDFLRKVVHDAGKTLTRSGDDKT